MPNYVLNQRGERIQEILDIVDDGKKLVSTDPNQGLTEEQKLNARNNIGAGDTTFEGNDGNVPIYSNQKLVDSGATPLWIGDGTDAPAVDFVLPSLSNIDEEGVNKVKEIVEPEISQLSESIVEISKDTLQLKTEFFDIDYTSDVGHYRRYSDDKVVDYPTGASKYTKIIPCTEGDVFAYKGYGASETYSYLLFSGSTIVGHGELSSRTVFTDVTIPSGVTGVKFQSFRWVTDLSQVILEVYKKDSIIKKIEELYSLGNVLYGKKWYCCGDSYSEGDYTDAPNVEDTKFADGVYKGLYKVYSRYISMRNKMDLHLLAKCGATLSMDKTDGQINNASFNPLTDTPTKTNNFFYRQLPQIGSDADYITLWFGINDSNNCNLGAITDNTVKTFYGALNWSLKYLIEHFPLAHIGVVVTNNCADAYQVAIRECCQKWAIPYLDMEGDKGVQSLSGRRDYQDIPVDASLRDLRWFGHFKVSDTNNYHPNQYAHEYESTFIENWLRSL